MSEGYFPSPPQVPSITYEYLHDHDWFEIGATRNPNATWTSLWACTLCPDVGRGGLTGPIPPGRCPCGWVQREWPRKRCEDCKRRLAA